MTAPLNQTRFRISGMDCASCAAKIDTAVRRIDGVEDVSVSVTGQAMTVSHAGALARDKVVRQVERLGYGIGPAPVAAARQAAADAGHDHSEHDHAGHDHENCSGHDHGGKPVAAHSADDGHGHSHIEPGETWWTSKRACLTAACAVALGVAYAVGHLYPAAERWAFLAALLVGLVPIARRALMAALAGTPFSIETLMTIAAIGAVIIGATEEAAAVVVLFLIGELLEGVAAGRARASIQGLADLVPKTALRVDAAGNAAEVPAGALAVGDLILVRPGDRVPADGDIAEGSGDLDEAPVTGESTPKRKGVGEPVFAGTISTDGVLKVRVTAAAQDNTIARVVRLVEEAQEAKAPTERFIDRFSRYYTPGVLAIGALVAVLPPLIGGGDWSAWVYKGLAILLIGCPCALVISTPAAIAAGLAAGARKGLLMKGGAVLERFGGIQAVAFDKTGTLTAGRPVVTDIVGLGRDEGAVLALAAALEQGSSHPLAVAILDRARAQGTAIPQASAAKAVSGKGVEGNVDGVAVFLGSVQAAAERVPLDAGQSAAAERLNGEGKTVSVLLADGAVAGLVAMRDEPRPDAAAGIAALKAEGIRAVMLTGDNRLTAEAIAGPLGIEARAGLLPQDKQRIVGEMQRSGLKVAKVGDGINDAPALAAADIGIAMGGGTDVALETADAAVLHGRVLDVARMVRLSRAAMANIRQNIAVALGLKAIFLVTTIAGITGLWPAILADTGATVLVTANAMRLLRWRG